MELNSIKGWFINANQKDKERELVLNLWFISMNGQFYFYYPSEDRIIYTRSNGAVTVKGKTISFSRLPQR